MVTIQKAARVTNATEDSVRAVSDQSNTTVAAYRGFTSECLTKRNDVSSATVLLLGGALQRKESWGPLATCLAKTFTVVTADLPGWGNADLLPDSYGIDFLADSLRALMIAAGHPKVHLFGGSYSSAIAYRYAQRYPDAVTALALAGTTSRITDQIRQVLEHSLELVAAGQVDSFAQFSADILLGDLSVKKTARQAAVRRILYNLFRSAPQDQMKKFEHNTRRLLREPLYWRTPPITVPVLVAVGQYDNFTPPQLGREVALTCRDSEFVVFPDAGHAIHLEVPSQLGNVLTRFFNGQVTEGVSSPALDTTT